MERNPYEYDRAVPWIPQQNRLSEARYIPARPTPQPADLQYQEWQQRVQDQKPRLHQRMPKARASIAVESSVQAKESLRAAA